MSKNLIAFRLKEPYLTKLKGIAKEYNKNTSILARELILSFLDGKLDLMVKTDKKLEKLLKKFIERYNIQNSNDAIKYILLRGLIYELTPSIEFDKTLNEAYEELQELKKKYGINYRTSPQKFFMHRKRRIY